MKKSPVTAHSPIASTDYQGYYLIPGFSQYVINKEGVLLHLKTTSHHKAGEPVKRESRSKQPVVWITPDHDRNQRLHVNKLVCLAFYGLPPSKKYVVGFHDENKLNIHSDNLYWMLPDKTEPATTEDNLKPPVEEKSPKEPTPKATKGKLLYGFNMFDFQLISGQTDEELSEKTGVALNKIHHSLAVNKDDEARPKFISDTGWVFSSKELSHWKYMMNHVSSVEKKLEYEHTVAVYARNTVTGVVLSGTSVVRLAEILKIDTSLIQPVFHYRNSVVNGPHGWQFSLSKPADLHWKEYAGQYYAYCQSRNEWFHGYSLFELSNQLPRVTVGHIITGLHYHTKEWNNDLSFHFEMVSDEFNLQSTEIEKLESVPPYINLIHYRGNDYRRIPGFSHYGINQLGDILVLQTVGTQEIGQIVSSVHVPNGNQKSVWLVPDSSSTLLPTPVLIPVDRLMKTQDLTQPFPRFDLPYVRVANDQSIPDPVSFNLTPDGHLVVLQGTQRLVVSSDYFETLRRLIQ